MQVGYRDASYGWQGSPADFGAGMAPMPCGSSGTSGQPSGAVSAVSGRNSTGAQSHMARRPSVSSECPQPNMRRASAAYGGTGACDSAGVADDNSNMTLPTALPDRDAADVFMDELMGVPQANVEQHQTMYVQYDGMDSGQVVMEWNQRDAMKAATMAKRKPTAVAAEFADLPLSCSIRIVQAPAAFARPMVQKKPFRPHFVVRMEMRFAGRVNFPVTMGAFPLSDSLYTKPSSLKPSAALNDAEVEGFLVSQRLSSDTSEDARNTSGEERTLTADFEFPDLKFVKSSRMYKRWLVFSLKIREDHVYVTYDLPTVILSRKTDQFGKAYEKLTGGPPPLKRARVPGPTVSAAAATTASGRATWALGSRPGGVSGGGVKPNVAMMKIDVQQAENWIVSKYREYLPDALRTLSDRDILWLLHKVDLNPNVTEPVMVAGHKWEQFEEWYIKCLETLQSVEDIWDQSDPEIICGFFIDRRRAEKILQSERPGTFLVRLCSEPGCFAVSSRTRFQNAFDHLLLDRVDLQRRRLLLWIQAHDTAQMLINTQNGQKIPKDDLFNTGFYKMPNFSTPQEMAYLGGASMGGNGGGGGMMGPQQGMMGDMGCRGGGMGDMMGVGVDGPHMFGMGNGNDHTSHFNSGGMMQSSAMQGHQMPMDMNLMDAPLPVPDAGAWGNLTGDFEGSLMHFEPSTRHRSNAQGM